jgi:hypothetical protein
MEGTHRPNQLEECEEGTPEGNRDRRLQWRGYLMADELNCRLHQLVSAPLSSLARYSQQMAYIGDAAHPYSVTNSLLAWALKAT